MDIDAVAEELYSLPPEDFTAARNTAEAAAKAAGDKQLAAAIHQLRKPNTGAWLANQLVRKHPQEVQSFLDLGAAFREATATLSGDQLRDLGKQRRQLVAALIQRVRELASAGGRKVSQDITRGLEETLHAALADERVAERLTAGRLTDTVQGQGFPAVAGATSEQPVRRLGADARPSEQPRPDDRRERNDRRERDERRDRDEHREHEEQLAQKAVRDTADERARALAALALAETERQEVTALVNALRADLEAAEAERLRREQVHRKADADLDAANRAGTTAERALAEIQRPGARRH